MTQPALEPPLLDVETYAETLARLQHHPPEAAPRILGGIGLTEPQWVPVRDRWIALIEGDIARGGALVVAFAAKFATTRRRLVEHGESLPPPPAPPEAKGASDPWAGLPPGMRAFSSIKGTEVAIEAPAQPALPFVPGAATAGEGPVRPAAPPAVDPWAGLPPGMRAFSSIKGTEMAIEAPAQPALPFVPEATADEGQARPAAPPASDPWAGLPAGMRAFSSIKGTEMAMDAPAQPALPFVPGAATADEGQARPAAPSSVDRWAGLPPGMRAFSSIKGTEMAIEAPAQPALPFNPASSPVEERPPCGLSLEQAASLQVELASLGSGVSRSDILQRYRLTEEQQQVLARYWGGRTAADAAIRLRWEGACAAYRAWLLQERRQPR